MRGAPTDRALLEAIFNDRVESYAAYNEDTPSRSSKIWMPIDLDALATRFQTDPDLLFGQLYYHLNHKYGVQDGEGAQVSLFQPRVGRDRHCVNFPFLASVLADLREEQKRFVTANAIAALSLMVSIVSLTIAALL